MSKKTSGQTGSIKNLNGNYNQKKNLLTCNIPRLRLILWFAVPKTGKKTVQDK